MSKIQKFVVPVVGVLASAGSALAEGESAFDAAASLTSAATTVGSIGAGIASLLGAAILLYLGFLGYRKGREAIKSV